MGQSGTGLAAVTLEQAGHFPRRPTRCATAFPAVRKNCAGRRLSPTKGCVSPCALKPAYSSSDEGTDASPARSADLRGVPHVDDLIKEFLAESNEGLERMDSELVKLEADPGSAELLASIFRA